MRGANGRRRENCNALVERVSLRKKPPHFRSDDVVDGLPVVWIGGRFQDLPHRLMMKSGDSASAAVAR